MSGCEDVLTFDNLQLSEVKSGALEGSAETVTKYINEAFSANTRRAYKSDLEHFRQWGGRLPADTEMLASYIAAHADQLSSATLSRRLVSIGKAHTVGGLDNPCRSDLVRATLRGVRRSHGSAQKQAKPLLLEDLNAVLDVMDQSPKSHRDRTLLLLGFSGALRRSELVGLSVEDIEFCAQGLILTIIRSKTDQEGRGRRIGIPFAKGRHCPVQALGVWLKVAGIIEGPVLRSVNRHGQVSEERLSDHAVSVVVKGWVARLGYDPTSYSGHSLRAGLATSAATKGLPNWAIKKQTGHASEASLARYIRDGELFSKNVVNSLL